MAGDKPAYVEALAVKDGEILFVGAKDKALAPSVVVVVSARQERLQGRCRFLRGDAEFAPVTRPST
jgi:hypothetical protein